MLGDVCWEDWSDDVKAKQVTECDKMLEGDVKKECGAGMMNGSVDDAR